MSASPDKTPTMFQATCLSSAEGIIVKLAKIEQDYSKKGLVRLNSLFPGVGTGDLPGTAGASGVLTMPLN